MFNIAQDTKIYIACPYGTVTGGTESLHQLVSTLNNTGKEAYIFYYNTRNRKKVEVPNKFKKYNIKIAQKINDEQLNILIVPEIATHLIYKYNRIQKCIWWLSLDFYFKSFPMKEAEGSKYTRNINNKFIKKIMVYIVYIMKIIIGRKYKMLDFDKDNNVGDYIHLYNCEYVRMFLLEKGINIYKTAYLCGPINKSYINDKHIIEDKKNIVCFNPAKDFTFANKLIEYTQQRRDDIVFKPIKNMTLAQVKNLLMKSKVYMDFGFFPGPERIPREAVVSYCNIMTSNRGSAGNEHDVLVPKKYKYDVDNVNIEIVYDGLIELLDDYKGNLHLYDSYRNKVEDQIKRFENDIIDIFK